MIPIKIRLMEYIRKQGGLVKNNDNRIPALLDLINPKNNDDEEENMR